MTAAEIRVRFPKASDAFIRANADGGSVIGPWFKTPKVKPRIRQDHNGKNKTELAFAAWIRAERCGAEVHEQAVTLKIANGCRYTPDVVTVLSGNWEAWEVKGFARDDAIVKIKVAATIYRSIRFYLVTKRTKKQGGGWLAERVLP